VPKARLKRAERIPRTLGLKPNGAVNMLLAQIELKKGMPFPVTAGPPRVLAVEEQATEWTKSLGEF